LNNKIKKRKAKRQTKKLCKKKLARLIRINKEGLIWH